MAGNGCPQGFRSVASFGFGGQESASKPPQAICKPLATILLFRIKQLQTNYNNRNKDDNQKTKKNGKLKYILDSCVNPT